MKNVIIIFGAALICIVLPFLLMSLHSAQMDSFSQSFTNITTSPSDTSANLSLGLEIYNDNIVNVSSISSNITGDYPTAAYFAKSGYVLEVSGLLSNSVRTLTVNYGVPSDILSDIPGISPVMVFVIYLFIFGVIGLIVGALINSIQHR
jgi:hypothetical protein